MSKAKVAKKAAIKEEKIEKKQGYFTLPFSNTTNSAKVCSPGTLAKGDLQEYIDTDFVCIKHNRENDMLLYIVPMIVLAVGYLTKRVCGKSIIPKDTMKNIEEKLLDKSDKT